MSLVAAAPVPSAAAGFGQSAMGLLSPAAGLEVGRQLGDHQLAALPALAAHRQLSLELSQSLLPVRQHLPVLRQLVAGCL